MASVVDLYRLGVSKVRPEARVSGFLIITTLLVCSLGINLLLARRVVNLKSLVGTMKSEARLAAGDKVPGITARDPQGNIAILDYRSASVPTVLFVISPTCRWCTQNIMNMRALNAQAGDRYRFVGLSLSSDKLSEYVAENKLQFPVYTDLPYAPMRDYKLGGTPQTIVVSPNGEVMKVWSGAFADNLQKDVEAFFDVNLPGLMDPEKALNE